MHVCTSLQTDNHASTPPLSFLQAGCPSCRPTNSVKALKASSAVFVGLHKTQTHTHAHARTHARTHTHTRAHAHHTTSLAVGCICALHAEMCGIYSNQCEKDDTIRYDTRCYFNVRSKADMSQLNLPHGTKSVKTKK